MNKARLAAALAVSVLAWAAVMPCAAEELEALEDEIHDPIEPVNRGIFWFNERVDRNVLEPVAEQYDAHVPRPVKKGISNFFANIAYPSYLVSDLVQLKFTQALEHTGRFLLNTTVGLVGFIDVAQEVGLPHHSEDFGVALAYHGVPPGPYLVLPFLGPSNLRDGVGRLVDNVLNPSWWIPTWTNMSSEETIYFDVSYKAVEIIDTRTALLEPMKAARESSLDLYFFLQSSYYQYRRSKLYDGVIPGSDPLDAELELENNPYAAREQ